MGLFSRMQEDRQAKKIDKAYADGRAAVKNNNMELAIKYFEEAANGGHKEAILSLIDHYEDHDIDKAYFWIKKYKEEYHYPYPLKNDKYRDLTIAYGKLHHDAEAIYQNANFMYYKLEYCASEGFYLMETAAELGHLDAQLFCAYKYYDGQKIDEDYIKPNDPKGNTPEERAVYWYKEAAKQGSAKANYNLAFMYYKGKNVPKDDAKAYEYALNARKFGDNSKLVSDIIDDLTQKFSSIDGIKAYEEKDYKKALPLLLEAAELGDYQSQCLCAKMHLLGLGCPTNDIVALEWYKKAAKSIKIETFVKTNTNYATLFHLAISFFVNGEYDVAYDIFDYCAKLLIYTSFLYLAIIYYHGTKNVSKDIELAKYYYEKWIKYIKVGDTIYLGSYPQNNTDFYYNVYHRNDSTKQWQEVGWKVLDIKDGKVLLLTPKGLILSRNNWHGNGQINDAIFNELENSFVLYKGLLNTEEFNTYVKKDPSLADHVPTTIFSRSRASHFYDTNLYSYYENDNFEFRYKKGQRSDELWADVLLLPNYSWWLKDGLVDNGVKPVTGFADNEYKVAAFRYSAWIHFPKE